MIFLSIKPTLSFTKGMDQCFISQSIAPITPKSFRILESFMAISRPLLLGFAQLRAKGISCLNESSQVIKGDGFPYRHPRRNQICKENVSRILLLRLNLSHLRVKPQKLPDLGPKWSRDRVALNGKHQEQLMKRVALLECRFIQVVALFDDRIDKSSAR